MMDTNFNNGYSYGTQVPQQPEKKGLSIASMVLGIRPLIP